MRRRYLFIYIALLMLTGQVAMAQNNAMRQVYTQADEEYKVGRIDEALTLLKTNIDNFQGGLKQSAFRLMALCSLGQDNTEEA